MARHTQEIVVLRPERIVKESPRRVAQVNRRLQLYVQGRTHLSASPNEYVNTISVLRVVSSRVSGSGRHGLNVDAGARFFDVSRSQQGIGRIQASTLYMRFGATAARGVPRAKVCVSETSSTRASMRVIIVTPMGRRPQPPEQEDF